MNVIIDLLFLIIIAVSGWTGYKKGLIMRLGGIIIIIISLYGANLMAQTFSYELVSVMKPFAGGYIEGRLASVEEGEEGILLKMGIQDELSLQDHIAEQPSLAAEVATEVYIDLGITRATAEEMAELAVEYEAEADCGIITATTQIVCMRISYVLCFALAFLIILIIFTVIGNLTNLSFRLPNLDRVNNVGGAVLGVITGLMFCVIFAWVLTYTGMFIGGDTIGKTAIAEWFVNRRILTSFIGV